MALPRFVVYGLGPDHDRYLKFVKDTDDCQDAVYSARQACVYHYAAIVYRRDDNGDTIEVWRGKIVEERNTTLY
jgi:hypothetical protein